MNRYKPYDLITFEDDEQVLCLKSTIYKGREYILACEYCDDHPSESVFVMKSIAEDAALELLMDKTLESEILRHFKYSS